MKISIIIPCYNVNIDLFNRCLNSIKEQTIGFDNIEIIVVDDCSTVNSEYIVNYCNKYNNIIYCKTEQNGGCGVARNKGFEYVTTDCFTIIDHDDYYFDDKVVEDIYNIMDNNNIDMLFGTAAFGHTPSNIGKLEKNKYKIYTNKKESDWILSIFPLTSAKCWRTKFIKENNLKNRSYRNSQDAIFMLETYLKAKNIGVYNRNFVYYEIQPTSVTNIKTVESLKTRLTAKIEFDKIAIKNGYKDFNKLTFSFNWVKSEIIAKTVIPDDKKEEINKLINEINKLENHG